ncbi:hypothetical protein SAMN02745883_00710 [Caminicella sporogenes DSM 14501]|uniref:Uncharacterized protein n=1 Tax=Caminicella sporogenes DSM 14501 TaxID=1121266 RepID=A0A1M6MZ10_9FIRM|nr:hypothetical protein [Caminicella sporogenes]RKD22438.1 hypothetical protein BET04_05240 [Caminicella sporogenes]SHJ88612.1 hypothetical protein SAMN02745883_00710 [Caminicella sporogenes DSM 14501]
MFELCFFRTKTMRLNNPLKLTQEQINKLAELCFGSSWGDNRIEVVAWDESKTNYNFAIVKYDVKLDGREIERYHTQFLITDRGFKIVYRNPASNLKYANANPYTIEEMLTIKNYLKEVGILEESEG